MSKTNNSFLLVFLLALILSGIVLGYILYTQEEPINDDMGTFDFPNFEVTQ